MPDDRPSTNSHVALIRVCACSSAAEVSFAKEQREISTLYLAFAAAADLVCAEQIARHHPPPPSTHGFKHVRAL
jgi:hypothetical protein